MYVIRTRGRFSKILFGGDFSKILFGDDFSKILFGDDFSGEIIPKQLEDDFSRGWFFQQYEKKKQY